MTEITDKKAEITKKKDGRALTSAKNGRLSGRPRTMKPTQGALQYQLMQEAHASELVEYFKQKKPRIIHALDQLFREGVERRSVEALKTYLNRVAGMPRQSIDIRAQVATLKVDL